MPQLRNGYRFDRFSNEEEANIFAGIIEHLFKKKTKVRELSKPERIVLDTEGIPYSNGDTFEWSACTWGVFYNNDTSLVPRVLKVIDNLDFPQTVRLKDFVTAVENDEKIKSIKLLRLATGRGLRESKDFVDKLFVDNCAKSD